MWLLQLNSLRFSFVFISYTFKSSILKMLLLAQPMVVNAFRLGKWWLPLCWNLALRCRRKLLNLSLIRQWLSMFKTLLSHIHLSKFILTSFVAQTFVDVDSDKDGKINKDDWKAFVIRQPTHIKNMTLPHLKYRACFLFFFIQWCFSVATIKHYFCVNKF